MPPTDPTPCRTRRLREMLGISGTAPAPDSRPVPARPAPGPHRAGDPVAPSSDAPPTAA